MPTSPLDHPSQFSHSLDGGGSWIQVHGQLNHVCSSRNGYIWGVAKDESIYKCKKPCNGGWERVDVHLRQIDGGNQFVYGINCHQQIWFCPVDGSGKWQTPRNNRAKYTTATGDNKVHTIGTDNKMYHCDVPCSNGWCAKLSDDTLTQFMVCAPPCHSQSS